MVPRDKVIEFTKALFAGLEQQSLFSEAWILTIATIKVRLLVIDPRKQVNLLPVEHLLQKDSSDVGADFTVYVADRSAVEASLPAKCWENADVQKNSSIAGFAEEFIYTSLEADFGNFFLVQHATRRGVKIFNLEKQSLPDWEYCYPLRKIINQFLIGSSYALIHGGGLADSKTGHGMVLTGKGESGKSTVCAVSVSNTIGYSGDDFLLVDTETSIAYCLYTSLKVRPHLAGRFKNHPVFAPFKRVKDNEKELYYLTAGRTRYLQRQFKITSLVKPRYFPELKKPVFDPLSKSEMVRYLSLSTLAVMRGSEQSDRENFAKIARLVRAIPCYTFSYNANASDISASVAFFLTNEFQRL